MFVRLGRFWLVPGADCRYPHGTLPYPEHTMPGLPGMTPIIGGCE